MVQPSGDDGLIQCVQFLLLTDDARGIRGIGKFQRLLGAASFPIDSSGG